MALDTALKRQSAAAIGLYPVGPTVVPSGAFDKADRQAIGYGYAGNLVGAASMTGEGALASVAATMAGVGVRTGVGTGALKSGAASINGVGKAPFSGTGALLSAAATMAGVGVRTGVGTGALNSGAASIAGVGSVPGETTLTPEDITNIVAGIMEYQLEPCLNVEQALRVMLAAMGGKASGAGTGTMTYRDVCDTTDRIVAITDGTGNRTTVTLDGD